MLHKQTYTYLLDYYKDDYFGQVEFFTDEPRKLSFKAADFTQCLVIDKTDFLNVADEYIYSFVSLLYLSLICFSKTIIKLEL